MGLSSARSLRMTLPNLFIIGAPKAGTTSLHSYLGQHPQIQMSAVKEPRFFAGPDNGFPFPGDRIESLAEYELLFDPAAAVRGESSTDYASHPRREGAPGRIHELVPEARFVYLVRDPIARSVSHYRMAAALFGERRPLSRALREELDEPRSRYIAPSLYATQLELYLRHFDRARILVLDQADLLAERRRTLGRVFDFLGVEDELPEEGLEAELNGSGEWRSYPRGYTGFVGRVVTPAVRWVPAGARRAARRRLERALWRPIETSLDTDVREQLELRFRPEAERLRALTGERFASWDV